MERSASEHAAESGQPCLKGLRRAKDRVGKLKTDYLREMWDELSLEAKKSTLALFIKKVIVYPGKLGDNRIEVVWQD